MKRINAEEINGKNFIGMWDIENDILLKNIIDFLIIIMSTISPAPSL